MADNFAAMIIGAFRHTDAAPLHRHRLRTRSSLGLALISPLISRHTLSPSASIRLHWLRCGSSST
jgi:hypothetical protein